MSVLSAASTTYITRIAIVKLRKAVLFECEIEVKRSGKILRKQGKQYMMHAQQLGLIQVLKILEKNTLSFEI